MTYFNSKTANSQPSQRKRFNPLSALRKTSRDFKGDKSGVAAIEFTFIAPIMIAIYFGLAEIASAISVDRRVSHTANVVGDLATQSATISTAETQEIFAAALRVLNIRDIQDVTIELSSYEMDNQNPPQPVLIGQATLNSGQTLPEFDAADVDERILNPTSGVVVARITYSYTPLKLRFFDTDIELKEIFLLKPRQSASIPIGDNPDSPINCSTNEQGNVSCGGTI